MKRADQSSKLRAPVATIKSAQPLALVPTAQRESAARPLLPKWQRERSRILSRVCKSAERAKEERGRPVEDTLAQSARQRRGKAYKCDPSRKLRLSRETLHRLYYKWLRSGRSAAAFELQYRRSRRQMSGRERATVRRHLLDPHTLSLAALHRSLLAKGEWTGSYEHLLRAVPDAWRTPLRRAFRARQRQQGVERRLKALLNGKAPQ